MHPACPNKKQNHLQNCLLRRTQFWVRKTFSKPASLKKASLVQQYNCYLADLHWCFTSTFYIEIWSCEMRSLCRKLFSRTACSHVRIEPQSVIGYTRGKKSLCGKLIWRWNVVFRRRFAFRRRLSRIPCVNHFVLEKLTLTLALLIGWLVIHVWMRISLLWELLEVFRSFLNSPSGKVNL